MSEQREVDSLEALLDQLRELAADRDRVDVGAVHEAVGRRSFGPMLLIPGLLALSPLSGMPGVPTTVGVMVLLITGQLLLGRASFWLPAFVRRRSIARDRLEKVIRMLRPVARLIDRLMRPRLKWVTNGLGVYIIAATCLVLSLIAPFLEIVPFAITGVGGAITAFGLSLIADDGALAGVAFLLCVGVAGVAVVMLL